MSKPLFVLIAALSILAMSGFARAESLMTSPLAGKWTYRSFVNSAEQVTSDPATAAEKLLGLLFAEAVFTFEIPTSTTLKGGIDWPGGGLDLQGTIRANSGATSPTVEIIGT